MNPGATARSVASITRAAWPAISPISTILPPTIATSARRDGYPVPSTTSPLRMTRSQTMESGEAYFKSGLVRLVPVASDPDVDDERDPQRRDARHQPRQRLFHVRELRLRHLEHQLVVHLHDQLRPELPAIDPLLHRDHRELDEIGRRALHRRVDRRTLGPSAPRGI